MAFALGRRVGSATFLNDRVACPGLGTRHVCDDPTPHDHLLIPEVATSLPSIRDAPRVMRDRMPCRVLVRDDRHVTAAYPEHALVEPARRCRVARPAGRGIYRMAYIPLQAGGLLEMREVKMTHPTARSGDEKAIRAIVFKEGDLYIAQCLEYDICVQSSTIPTLMDRLDLTVEAEFETCRLADKAPHEMICQAPNYYHSLWEKRTVNLSRHSVVVPGCDDQAIHFAMTDTPRAAA